MKAILISLFTFSLVACSGGGFSLEKEELLRLNSEELNKSQDSKYIFNTIDFQQQSLVVKNDSIVLKALVKHLGNDYGIVELSGKLSKHNFDAILKPVDKDIQKWLGAKISCLGESASGDLICTEYYISVIVQKDGKHYFDQFLKHNRSPQTAATKPSEEEIIEIDESAVPQYNDGNSSDEGSDENHEGLSEPVGGIFSEDPDQVFQDVFEDQDAEESANIDTNPKTNKTPKFPQTVVEQAIGFPSQGSLRNPYDILNLRELFADIFYSIGKGENTQDHYGVNDMGAILKLMAEAAKKIMPDFVFQTNGVAMKSGGIRKPSVTHQTGLDADINFMTTRSKEQPFATIVGLVPVTKKDKNGNVISKTQAYVGPVHSSFKASEQWSLIKIAFASGRVNGMFMDRKIKAELCKIAIQNGEIESDNDIKNPAFRILSRIKHADNHYHHIHLRIRCPEGTKKCGETLTSFKLNKSECF